MTETRRPLDGILVIDFTHALAGPTCTAILADFGARVIKVEGINKGDISRSIISIPKLADEIQGGDGFQAINRNKESISVNLRSAEGKQLILDLAKKADVMVSNFRPGVMDDMGFGYEVIHGLNERLIYCDISAFGRGPDESRPGMDVVVQAYSGTIATTGTDFDHLVKPGPSLSDMAGGLVALQGILFALINRDHTGKGQYVHTSLQEATMQLLLKSATAVMEDPTFDLQPEGLGHPELVPCQGFRTSDGWIFVAVGTNKLWDAFCVAMGVPDYAKDERYHSVVGRSKNRVDVIDFFGNIFIHDTTQAWEDKLTTAGVPVAPILTPKQSFMKAIDNNSPIVATVDHPLYGKLYVPGVAIQMSDTPARITKAAPRLGEDTSAVLKGLLAMSDQDVATLEDQGVVKQYRD